jgi:hypothetical protein
VIWDERRGTLALASAPAEADRPRAAAVVRAIEQAIVTGQASGC